MLPDSPIFSSRAYTLKKSQAMPLEWYGCHKTKFEYYIPGGSFSHKLLLIFLKVAPKFFKSYPKLPEFSKKLLLMTTIFAKWQPLFANCCWWSTIMQPDTTALFRFLIFSADLQRLILNVH